MENPGAEAYPSPGRTSEALLILTLAWNLRGIPANRDLVHHDQNLKRFDRWWPRVIGVT